MNIQNLDLVEIGNLFIPDLCNYFKGAAISNLDEGLFVESYLFDFEEVRHLIPEQHCSNYEKSDLFNCASGVILFDAVPEEMENKEYSALLLVNEDYSRALVFAIEETDSNTGENKIITLRNFIEDEGD